MKLYYPIKVSRITQRFGENAVDFYKKLGLKGHNGIDLAYLSPEVYYEGTGRGTVYYAVNSNTFGNYLCIISEEDIGTVMHLYGHLKEFRCKVGDTVESGQIIAIADNTGLYTTGQHLHWGIYTMIKDANGNYAYKEPNNGYGGAIDQESYVQYICVKDYINNLNQQISILQTIIELLKKLIIGIKK